MSERVIGSHGAGGWSAGCRCEVCTRYHREAHARWRASKRPEDAAGHGTHATYSNYGCRCGPCTEAHQDYMAAFWQRRREAAARAAGSRAEQSSALA